MTNTNNTPNVFANRKNSVTMMNENGPIEWTVEPLSKDGKMNVYKGDGIGIEIAKAVFRAVATNLRFTGSETFNNERVFEAKDRAIGHKFTTEGLHVLPVMFDDPSKSFNIGFVHRDFKGTINGKKIAFVEKSDFDWFILNRTGEMYFAARMAPTMESIIEVAVQDSLEQLMRGEGIQIQVSPFRPYFGIVFETLNQKNDKAAVQLLANGKQRSKDRQKLNTTIRKGYDSETKEWNPEVAQHLTGSIEVVLEGTGPMPIHKLDAGRYGLFNNNGDRIKIINLNPEDVSQFTLAELKDAREQGYTLRLSSTSNKTTI